MTNLWAPKSAKDDADEPLVLGARRLHLILFIAGVVLGLLSGFVLFEVLDQRALLVLLEELVDDEYEWDALLRGFHMVLLAFAGGELGSALWLLLCRYRLGLSSEQVRAALAGSLVYSLVVGPLRARLYRRL